MLGWFKALMPKEELFFDLFDHHAEVIVKGAEALRELLQGSDIERYYAEIVARENDADEITREVLTAVRRSFITPFDRTDIQDLITSMDDAIDQMNKTAKIITLFEVRTFEPQMREMADVIVQAAKLVLQAIPLLRSVGKNASSLNALTSEVIRIEEHADQLYDEGRRAAFLAHRDSDSGAMKFIVAAAIYDHLEKVVDRFEDVSNEINSLVIDHL